MAIDKEFLVNVDHISNPVQKPIEKYKNHPSVKAISEIQDKNTFNFSYLSLDEIKKEINNLNTRKTCQDTNILTKIVQGNFDIQGVPKKKRTF